MKKNIESETPIKNIAEIRRMTQRVRETVNDGASQETDPRIEAEDVTPPDPSDELWDYSVCNF